MRLLQLLVEALLYYVACHLMARDAQKAPGIFRVFLIVALLAFISGGIRTVIGDFWLGNALVLVINFLVLWIGLGVGFFRTIIAALIVSLLRSLLEAVFGSGGSGLHLLG